MIKSTLIAVTFSFAPVPHAMADPPKPVHIPPGPLVPALKSLSEQMTLQLVYQPKQLKSFRTDGVSGVYTARNAVRLLLKGTPLVVEYGGSGAMAIVLAGSSKGSSQRRSDTKKKGVEYASSNGDEGTKSSSGTAAGESGVPNPIPPAGVAAERSLAEVVVTGTHLKELSGFSNPTPVTVVGPQRIQEAGPANLADFVNELPALAGSATPVNSNLSFSNGQAGINALNLRGLGTERTLVLIDGERSVGSTITGEVDINDIPQSLVKSVQIVTGGASAVYGSDAVAGVVNFILDKDFTGFKVEASGGETTYGDDPTEELNVTAGLPFAAGRGHFLINAEDSNVAGIYGVPRSWNNEGVYIMENPAYRSGNGLPQELAVSGAGLDEATLGGIITNTALRGVDFGPGGAPGQFSYGPITDNPWTQGGEWQSNQFNYQNTLVPQEKRENVFTYTSYDLTDNITAFVQLSRAEDISNSEQLQQFNVGNIVINAGNPFIPSSVAQRMTALGISQFNLGTMNGDIPPIEFNGTRITSRLLGGLNGKFDMFGSTWDWNAYYQDGITRAYATGYNVTESSRYVDALDAVTDPTTGAPVCAVTLANPASSCLPYNPMGLGVNSQATIDYLTNGGSGPHQFQRFTEDDTSAIVNGKPFSVWAGPVALAFGVEHRRDFVTGAVDRNSAIDNWFAGNYLPTEGSFTVTEGFVEADIPVLKNLPFAQGLDFNGAFRRTDYSESGPVSTWKLGGSWQPIKDLHFRATRSQDIRAPNLNDLFAAGTHNTNSVIDPFDNNADVGYEGDTVGNPNLKPEVADTLTYGVVLTPRFAAFEASADYYQTTLHNAIGTVSAQTIVDNCYEGIQSYCALLKTGVGAGGAPLFTQILIEPLNLVELINRGVDMEAAYRFNLSSIDSAWRGALTLHALATHYLENYTYDGPNSGVPAIDTAGSNGTYSGTALPSWIFNGTITYTNSPVTLAVTGRGFSAGTISPQYVQCSSGCPLSTANAITINDNHATGAVYLDFYGSYKFDMGTAVLEAFMNVTNVTNRAPGFVPNGPGGISYAEVPTNESLYDVEGRTYRVGVRMFF